MINQNNKYYTPQWLVKKVLTTALIILSGVTITEIIEPSAGAGAFINEIERFNIPSKYYDLYPEHQKIIEQDYLNLKLEYLKGRMVIGNPPFGDYKEHLYQKFIKKSAEIADYVVFILPSSQYNNNFNSNCKLIYSEMLGNIQYDGENKVKLRTCLNIYQKGIENSADFNSRNYIKTCTIEKTNRDKKYFFNGFYWNRDINQTDCDIYISCFGKIHFITDKNELKRCQYVGVKILNLDRYDEIMDFLKTFENKYFEEIKNISISATYFSHKFLHEKFKESFL